MSAPGIGIAYYSISRQFTSFITGYWFYSTIMIHDEYKYSKSSKLYTNTSIIKPSNQKLWTGTDTDTVLYINIPYERLKFGQSYSMSN